MKQSLIDGESKLSETVTYARAIALVSIVSAHIQFATTAYEPIVRAYRIIASIGVVLYMIIAGYYYRPAHYGSIVGMAKRKLTTIVLPWFCLGTTGYLYKAILSGNLSLGEYFNFLLGNGSYLYYLSILSLCFVLFFYFHGRWFCILCIFVTMGSLYMTQAGLLNAAISKLGITNYLNLLNWIGFFALGVLLQRNEPDRLYQRITKYRLYSICAFMLVYGFVFWKNIPTGYFSKFGWMLELLGATAFIAIASYIPKNCRLIKKIAGYSFTVYLVHFMVIGLFDRLYNFAVPLQAIANLIVIAISVFAIDLCLLIAKKAKAEQLAVIVLGVRKG